MGSNPILSAKLSTTSNIGCTHFFEYDRYRIMKTPPYHHADGSNCWTKNCSRGHASTQDSNAAKARVEESLDELFDQMRPKTYIDTIAPLDEFYAAAERNEVMAVINKDGLPYTLFKYTPVAQYKGVWNDVTLNSRGLIVNHETGEIVARPFSKFFNYGETGKLREDLMTGPISVSEKLDGSLGISFRDPEGKMRITTSGGWQAPQGKFATKFYHEHYEGKWNPDPNRTYMWEIIHPENRIVVDYGDEKDLHLLGAVDIRTGKSIPVDKVTEWKWKRAESHSFDSMADVTNAPDRANHEGYIVHYTDTDYRVKVKHDEYVRIHRDATGLNERRIWEAVKEGKADESRAAIQEEFHEFFDTNRKAIQENFDTKMNNLHAERQRLVNSFTGTSQKEWAEHVRQNGKDENKSVMFSAREGLNLPPLAVSKLWDSIKPAYAGKTFNSMQNDTLE